MTLEQAKVINALPGTGKLSVYDILKAAHTSSGYTESRTDFFNKLQELKDSQAMSSKKIFIF